MAEYNDLPTLTQVLTTPEFRALSGVVKRITKRQKGITKRLFEQRDFVAAAKALNEWGGSLRGLVGQGEEKETSSPLIQNWRGTHTALFFVRPEPEEITPDDQNWLHLVSMRLDLSHFSTGLLVRRLPVRVDPDHLDLRLARRAKGALVLGSDEIGFASATSTLLSFIFQRVPDVPQGHGIIPFALPHPDGMFLGRAVPCDPQKFQYAHAERYVWVAEQTSQLAQKPSTGLPGLTSQTPLAPFSPGKGLLKPLPIPNLGQASPEFKPLSKPPHSSPPNISYTLKSLGAETYLDPTFQVSIHTFVSWRQLKEHPRDYELGQARLYWEELHPLLGDKSFLKGVIAFSQGYLLGKAALTSKAPLGESLNELTTHATIELIKLVRGKRWAAQAEESLRSYARDRGLG